VPAGLLFRNYLARCDTVTDFPNSLHVGVTGLGHKFGDVYPELDKEIMGPYTEFLHSMFCEYVLLDSTSLLIIKTSS